MSPALLSTKALFAAVLSLSLSISLLLGTVLAAPHHKPHNDNPPTGSIDALINPTSFPALTNDALIPQLQVLAQGSLPNGPPPPPSTISDQGILNLQLIMLNEFFESAFFASLLHNVTNKVEGFHIKNKDSRALIVDSLTAIVAQEQLHGIGAAKILGSQNAATIAPCTYKFPTTNFHDAIAFADLFTEVVLGTLQDVQQIFSTNNDHGLVRLIGSVIGQEGQQDGSFRLLQHDGKVPSALPFLTTSTRDFSFSILEQNLLVACPNDSVLKAKLKLYGVLSLAGPREPCADNETLDFTFDLSTLTNSANVVDHPNQPATAALSYSAYGKTWSVGPGSTTNWARDASLVYLNQQNQPIVVPLQNVAIHASTVSFTAAFPYSANDLNGLTLAVLVSSNATFNSAADVASLGLAGPVPFIIN